jgi:integral membrane protein (TIGR00529 family)
MIDWLIALPAFVKVTLSFAGILLVYRLGLPLGWSIVIHSLLLSLWTGAGTAAFVWQAQGFIRPRNYLLLAVIFVLLYFTESLDKTGRMERTVNALKRWLSSHRALLSGLPALVGLLPMPGGALVSAPLVASVDSGNELEPELKVAVNYWFRHIWEYWWPLYPGVILAIQYCGLPIGVYYLVMMPFTVIAVASGYVFILRRVKRVDGRGAGTSEASLDMRDVSATLWPIGLLVAVSIVGSTTLPRAGISARVANLAAMLAGIGIALPLVFKANGKAFLATLQFFRNRKIWAIMVVVVGIQTFSEALKLRLDEHGSTLVSLMRDEFLSFGVPIVIVMMILPFISGFVTGLAVGFVGASFPLVFALLGPDPGFNQLAATTVFAYSFGYMGMILSPVHICFVVTNEYFKTRLFRAYPLIVGPVLSVLVAAVALSALLYVLL